MPNYTSVQEMCMRLGVPDTSNDASIIAGAIDAAEAAVENYCGRVFTLDAVATPRVFYPIGWKMVEVDDIATTSGLIVADTSTTHTSTNYQLEPRNGIGPNGRPWPYTRIRLLSDIFAYPIWPGQATVTITAKWGWPAVPAPVKEAVRELASDLYHMKDNQYGVAGFGDMGVVRIKANPVVQMLLEIYRAADIVVGIA